MTEWPSINPSTGFPTDYHGVVSVQFGELVEVGFIDLVADDWAYDAYSEEQRARLNEKITNRFYFREIGIVPPGRWKREFLRKLNEIMPKYKLLYKALDDGVNVLADSDEYGKSRDIFSEFPATMLGDNQDYASNGRDRQYERVRLAPTVDAFEAVRSRYADVDVMILDELEVLFSSLLTVSMSGY